jgi:hypothetical protein
MKHKRSFLFLIVLVLASLACGLFTGGGSDAGESPLSPGDTGGSGGGEVSPTPEAGADSEDSDSLSMPGNAGEYDTEFPLPEDVQNFLEIDENTINYQTSMSLSEVVDFYRESFNGAGYEERDILTVIEDNTVSLVWDGHPSGQAIIVQGVDLGNGTTNVNVRFEDV